MTCADEVFGKCSVEVVITAESTDWLADFTRKLVEDRLVACGHNIAQIRAIYRWEGKIYDEPQVRVELHTRACGSFPRSSPARTATMRTTSPASSPYPGPTDIQPTVSGSTTRPIHRGAEIERYWVSSSPCCASP